MRQGTSLKGSAQVDPQDSRAAQQAALRILAGATQSQAALQRRLLQRGFAKAVVAATLEMCIERGYVNDRALAESVAARRLRNGYGRERIVMELRQRGIPDPAIVSSVADIDAGLEFEQALIQGRRLLGALRDDEADWYPFVGAKLRRRGYASAT